ncbi:MAG: coiled coil domain-containing protein [Gammaproteobacteria bacterium]
MSKQAYCEKLEAQLREWDARLDLIKAKAKGLQAEGKIEYESQIQALQHQRQEALARLEDLSKRSELAWEDLKDGTERAWGEFGKAMESFTSRFK